MRLSARLAIRTCFVAALTVATLGAHSGPPFPIVTDQVAGPYRVSVWTDPDSTDDGAAGGQFWVTVDPADSQATRTPTTVTLLVEPADRAGAARTALAEPVNGDSARHFAAVVMDHEGRFRVRVTIAGPLGSAFVDSEVNATYDQRPPPVMIAVYLLPFLLVGFLWVKLLLRRRLRGHSTGTVKGDTQD